MRKIILTANDSHKIKRAIYRAIKSKGNGSLMGGDKESGTLVYAALIRFIIETNEQ